jgi:peptidoglycan hydrolase CwlO-like protein
MRFVSLSGASTVRKILSCCLSLALAGAAMWAAQGASAESVQEKLDKARAEEQTAKDALTAAEGHLQDVLNQYRQLQLDLDAAARDIVALQSEQDAVSAQLSQAQDQLSERVTTAYELGPAAAIDLFLGAQSTADFASVQVFVSETFQVDDSTVSDVTRLKTSLATLTTGRQARQDDLASSIALVQALAEQAEIERADATTKADAAGVEVKRLEKKEAEVEAARAAAAAALSKYLGTGEVSAGCGSGPVHDLIVEAFTPLGTDQVQTALAVATRESNCRPNAYNKTEVPPYGNASGVFQILYPGIWEPWSARCGYDGADVFDPEANVAVAACVVADQGWWPWGF